MKRSRPATEEKQRIDPNVPEALTRLGLVPCSLQQQIDRLRKDVVDTNHDAAEEQAECSSDEECIGPTGRRIWYVSDPDATCNATFRRALMILRRDVCPGPGMNVSQKQVVVACARAIEETGKSSVWCSKQTKFNNQSKSFGRSQGSSITTNSDIHHFCQAPWTNLLKRIGMNKRDDATYKTKKRKDTKNSQLCRSSTHDEITMLIMSIRRAREWMRLAGEFLKSRVRQLYLQYP